MRNLAIALSVGFLGLANAGCSDTAAASGQIQLTWEIRQGDVTGPVVNCAAGEHVDVTVGSITDQFDCTAGAGVTGALPIGTFPVTFDLVLNNQVESTETLTLPIANRSVTDAGHVIFVIAGPADGTLQFEWTLHGQASGSALTCAPSGETFVINLGGGGTFQAPCPGNQPSGTVVTPNVPAGTYSAMISLNMGSTVESTVTVPVTIAGGQTTDLGTIDFLIAGMIHR